MQTEQIDICDGLKVSVEFVAIAGIIDRTILKERIREHIQPRVRQKILCGRDTLPDIVFVRDRASLRDPGKRICRGGADNHPNWGSVPGIDGAQPPKPVPAIW